MRVEYQALYRKYRPQSFDDVIGQAHVTTTLSREIAEGRVAHAYLFTGPRGTGKTTTARILAKALNCPNRSAEGAPCNKCESCAAITEGVSLDVLELDAASHNSVEDIRDIRVSVTTVASSASSRRVFILDEAHMLSKAAGNALLKTLEEPPEHVHFVLATTEPYKLLDTIRSRSQRFDFHPIGTETLAGYLAILSDRESYAADPAALVAIARHAAGSARDSLSLLEQVAALGEGKVDVGGVRRALGLAGSEAFSRLGDAMAGSDARAALELVAELAAEGVDLRRFVAESIGYLRGVFLAHYAPNLEEITDESIDTYQAWRNAAKILTPAMVLRGVDALGEALLRLREGREERLMTEMALIKLTRPETATDEGALLARLERLENRTQTAPSIPVATADRRPVEAEERPAAQQQTDHQPVIADMPAAPSAEEPASPPTEQPAIDIRLDQLQAVWPGLFGSLRDLLGARRWAFFREAVPAAVDGNTIVLEIAHAFHLESLSSDPAVSAIVATRAGDLLGTPVKVRFRAVSGDTGAPELTEAPEKDRLLEKPENDLDPASLLAAELGAEVVGEDET